MATLTKKLPVIADVVLNVIDQLKKHRNIALSNVSLTGFSTGSDIAVLICEEARERFPEERFGVVVGTLTLLV